MATEKILAAIDHSGAIRPGESVLALLSGGADSVCLVHALAEHLGKSRVAALHVNHGLREAAVADERFCAELCEANGLAWREDESNRDRGLARNLLRLEVIPLLREVHPAVERNVLSTAAVLRDEQEVLDQAVDDAIRASGAGGRPPAVELARLAQLAPAVRRLVLTRLAEDAGGASVPIGREDASAIERLAAAGGSGSVSLPGGVEAVCEYGIVRFQRPAAAALADPVELDVPGRCRFGDWELRCTVERLGEAAGDLGSVDAPVLDAALLAPTLTVRRWTEGDRMSPLGLAGTKSLQDLFVDRKVP